MAGTAQQLSGHAAGHLYADRAHAHANISLLHIYDQRTAPGGVVRFKQILRQVQQRLHRWPPFRQRLQRVPLQLDHPWWVDDEQFDLEYHVRHIALPKPGDWRQFCIQVSRIHARPLDLDRPLWELYVIEGLDSLLELPPGSFALMLKSHQAAVEPAGLGALTALLHDDQPQAADAGLPEPWFADSPPGRLSLLAHGLRRSLGAPLKLARPLAQAAGRVAPAALALAAEALRQPGHMPVTRFNAVVSPHRVFETRRFAVAECEAIARTVPGATVEDVLVSVCGGALRRYLAPSGELPERASLGATVHDAGQGLAAPGTGWPLPGDAAAAGSPGAPRWRHLLLGTHLADPRRRLAWVRQRRRRPPDALTRVMGGQRLAALGDQASAALLSAGQRLAGLASAQLGAHRAPVHCSLHALPAVDAPAYLCGARLSWTSALLPVHDGLGLALAVGRCDGRLIVSPTACREQLPDPEVFAQALRDSFQEHLALVARVAPVDAAAAGVTAAAAAGAAGKRRAPAAARPPRRQPVRRTLTAAASPASTPGRRPPPRRTG